MWSICSAIVLPMRYSQFGCDQLQSNGLRWDLRIRISPVDDSITLRQNGRELQQSKCSRGLDGRRVDICDFPICRTFQFSGTLVVPYHDSQKRPEDRATPSNPPLVKTSTTARTTLVFEGPWPLSPNHPDRKSTRLNSSHL